MLTDLPVVAVAVALCILLLTAEELVDLVPAVVAAVVVDRGLCFESE